MNFAEIKKRSAKGGVVTFGAQAITSVVQVGSTIALARLLSPDDYGIIAMVLAITGFAELFKDLGLSAASIQKGDLSLAQTSKLFWLNVIMGTLLTLVLVGTAPLLAKFYGRAELEPLAQLMALNFLISSIGTQSGASLQREMRFIERAGASVSSALGNLVIACILAIAGFGYWSIAWGTVGGGLISTIILFKSSGFRPIGWVSTAPIRQLLNFGAGVTGFNAVNYFHRSLDNILIGKVWGAVELGLYSRAYQLLMFPINNIRSPLNAVAYPALSRLQKDSTGYRQYFCKVLIVLSSISMPLMGFLFVASEEIIALALGEKWSGVASIFSILAISGFIQPAASLRGLVLMSLGNGKRYFYWGLINAILTCIGFTIGVRWGAYGVAISYAVVNYGILLPSLHFIFCGTPLKIRDFFGTIAIPSTASVFAVIAVMLVKMDMEFIVRVPSTFKVILLFTLFMVTYLACYSASARGRSELKWLLKLKKSLH